MKALHWWSACLALLADSLHAFALPRRQLLTQFSTAAAAAAAAASCPVPVGAEEITVTSVQRLRNKIYLLGDLGPASCDAIRCAVQDAALECLAVQAAYTMATPPPVELHIQSAGGALMPTLSAVDAILACPVPTHSYIEGYAASSATLLSVVCTKKFGHAHSVALLHQISGGMSGTANTMNDEFRNMELFMSIIKGIYLKHTSIAREEMDDLLKHDLWLSAEECQRLGIIDAIV